MRVSGELAEIIIPILGHIGFLPIMSTLFNIFLCDKSIGDEFTDSFMNKDCYEFC